MGEYPDQISIKMNRTTQYPILYIKDRKNLRAIWFFLVPTLLVFVFEIVCYASLLTIRDEVGREVTFRFPPKKIISLAPNITEILFSLSLDEEIVGVSIHCNYPDKAKSKPRVGTYLGVDFERVVHIRPDLIIATGAGNPRDVVERLEKLGLQTYVVFPKNFDGILQSIIHIGQVVDRKKKALTIVQNMETRKERIVRLTKRLNKPKVFFQIGEAPIFTVGKGSFGDNLINLAGGQNIAGREKEMYPRWGIEEVIKRSPDVIIISSMNPKGDYDRVLKEWDRWKVISAVRNRRIHLINSDLVDRPSPRIIDGLEEMAKILHPEIFKK